MKKLATFLLLILTSYASQAQFIKEKAINAQVGYAICFPYNSISEVASGGFFVQGELVLKAASWVDFRPYAGFAYTNSNGRDINNNPTYERAETTSFMLGGKARLRAPIPYVAPYIELGLGASFGKFDTFTYFDVIEKKGVLYHVPFSLGLELGKNHNVDLGVTYFFHPDAQQFTGALAVGLTFPLDGTTKNQQ